MLDPEFLEWLDEGTREEVYDKKRRFIKYLREHPEIYVGDPKWLDELEASINRSEAATHKINYIARKKAVIEENLLTDKKIYDETLPKKQPPLMIPLFGKSKKDSH